MHEGKLVKLWSEKLRADILVPSASHSNNPKYLLKQKLARGKCPSGGKINIFLQTIQPLIPKPFTLWAKSNFEGKAKLISMEKFRSEGRLPLGRSIWPVFPRRETLPQRCLGNCPQNCSNHWLVERDSKNMWGSIRRAVFTCTFICLETCLHSKACDVTHTHNYTCISQTCFGNDVCCAWLCWATRLMRHQAALASWK